MSNIRTYRVNHAMQMISIPLHSTTNSYHLGNNDEVVDAKGVVQQVTNYYPFGAPYADATAVKDADFQPYKYNGKEFDHMHGLNTYDYGARQYNPVTARWDRIDPLCEKYYNVSPYNYCHNNPVMLIDPDGRDDYYTPDGEFLGTVDVETDNIYIAQDYRPIDDGAYAINPNTSKLWTDPSLELSADACSKILTNTFALGGYNTNELANGRIEVNVIGWEGGAPKGIRCTPNAGDIKLDEDDHRVNSLAFTDKDHSNGARITVNYQPGEREGYLLSTRSNVVSLVGDHEFKGHYKFGYRHEYDGFTDTVFIIQINSPAWQKTTAKFKEYYNGLY